MAQPVNDRSIKPAMRERLDQALLEEVSKAMANRVCQKFLFNPLRYEKECARCGYREDDHNLASLVEEVLAHRRAALIRDIHDNLPNLFEDVLFLMNLWSKGGRLSGINDEFTDAEMDEHLKEQAMRLAHYGNLVLDNGLEHELYWDD